MGTTENGTYRQTCCPLWGRRQRRRKTRGKREEPQQQQQDWQQASPNSLTGSTHFYVLVLCTRTF